MSILAVFWLVGLCWLVLETEKRKRGSGKGIGSGESTTTKNGIGVSCALQRVVRRLVRSLFLSLSLPVGAEKTMVQDGNVGETGKRQRRGDKADFRYSTGEVLDHAVVSAINGV